MVNLYTYLISSLPMLHFGMRPPFSFERFLEQCHHFIPERDFQVLQHLPKPEQYTESAETPRVIRRWIAFDIALRNELVRLRAGKKHIEPSSYLRPGGTVDSSISSAVMAASVHPSILEGERILDETRWRYLEELATGHSFDQEVLITYAYKLLILQRWELISRADPNSLLQQTCNVDGV